MYSNAQAHAICNSPFAFFSSFSVAVCAFWVRRCACRQTWLHSYLSPFDCIFCAGHALLHEHNEYTAMSGEQQCTQQSTTRPWTVREKTKTRTEKHTIFVYPSTDTKNGKTFQDDVHHRWRQGKKNIGLLKRLNCYPAHTQQQKVRWSLSCVNIYMREHCFTLQHRARSNNQQHQRTHQTKNNAKFAFWVLNKWLFHFCCWAPWIVYSCVCSASVWLRARHLPIVHNKDQHWTFRSNQRYRYCIFFVSLIELKIKMAFSFFLIFLWECTQIYTHKNILCDSHGTTMQWTRFDS